MLNNFNNKKKSKVVLSKYRRTPIKAESLGQNNVQNTNGQRHYLANAVNILVLYFTMIFISVDLILGEIWRAT